VDEWTIETAVHAAAAAHVAAAADPSAAAARAEEIMYVGVAALQLFLQANWTGPPVDPGPVVALLPNNPATTSGGGDAGANAAAAAGEATAAAAKSSTRANLDALLVSGETAFDKAELPGLLLVARGVLRFVAAASPGGALKTSGVWLARCFFTHQRILESPVAPLKEVIFEHLQAATDKEGSLFAELDRRDLPAQLLLEQGLAHSFYKQYNQVGALAS
jgi:hypothetical protein